MADEFELTPELDIKSKNLADIIAAIEAQSAQDATSNFWVNSYATGSKAKPLDNYDDKSKRHFNNTKTFLDALLGSRARDSIEDNRLDLYNKAANEYSKAFSGDAYQEKPYQSIQDALIDMNKVDQSRTLGDWKEREAFKNKLAIDKYKAENSWAGDSVDSYGKPMIGGIGSDTGEAIKSSPYDFGFDAVPLDDLFDQEYKNNLRMRMPPGEAAEQARKTVEAKKFGTKGLEKKLTDLTTSTEAQRNLSDELKNALTDVGDTGTLGGLKQKAAGWLQYLPGSFGEDQAKKYAAGQKIEGLGAKFVAAAPRAPGSVSDLEFENIMKSGASLKNEEEYNKFIQEVMDARVQRNYDKIDFMTTLQEDFGKAGFEAENAWNKYERANPLFKKDTSGQYLLNPTAKNWQEYFARGGQAPTAPIGVPGERSRNLNISQIADDFLRLGGDGYGMEEGEVELLNTFVPVAQKMLQTDDVNLILQQLKNPEFAQAVSQQIAGQAQPMPNTGTVQAPQMDREAIKAQVKELKRQGKTDAEIKMILGGK